MALFSLDIETTGLDRFKDEILCIGMWSPDEHFVFKTVEELWTHLAKNPETRLIMHSGAFDYGFIKHQGLDLEPYWVYDTKTIASVLYPRPTNLGLETLTRELLGLEDYKLDRDNIHEKYSQEEIEAYCIEDCRRTYALFKELVTRLVRQSENSWQFVESWIMPATKLAARMEYTGIVIDQDALNKFSDKVTIEYQKATEALEDMTQLAREEWHRLQVQELKTHYEDMLVKASAKKPTADPTKLREKYLKLFSAAASKIEPFNFGSPKQVLWLLKDYFKLKVTRGRDDKESAGVEVLTELASEGNELCKVLYNFRKQEKRINASIPAIRDNIKPDGAIHPRFHVGGTHTGRLSSSNPNFQQVERGELRQCFIARPGYNLVTIDYAQIEVRIMAELSREPKLLEAFDLGLDPYSLLVKSLFSFVPEIAECDVREIKAKYPKYRDVGKTAGLSIFYGTGARKLAETIKKMIGLTIPVKKATEIITNYRESFPALSQYKQEVESLLSNRKIAYNLIGRPLMIESNEDLYMKAMNHMVQGSASDLVVDAACNEIPQALKDIEYRILALVHDEVILEIPDTYGNSFVKEVIEPAMTTALMRKHGIVVPLKIEYHVGKRWEKA